MENFWIILRITVNCFCPLALIFAMCEFKCARRRALWIILSGGALCAFFNSALFLVAGREVMMRFYALILFVPMLIILLTLTRDRFAMLFFDFFTAVNLLYLVSIAGHIVSPELIWLDALVRILLYAVAVWLCSRYFSGPWHFLAKHMEHGWGVICVIPFLFFALVMFLGLFPRVRNDHFAAVIFLYLILIFVYIVIYEVFRSTYAHLTQEENVRLLSSQLSMQARQLKMQEDHLEKLRILRHDFRHYMRSLSVLMENGELKEAKKLAGGIFRQFNEPSPQRYCSEPVLNAELSYYMEKAKLEGIELALDGFTLPKPLPVDTLELCVVFGNALENAFEACLKAPEGIPKRIGIICKSSPRFVFEIANTYDGKPVLLDEEGFPISEKPGHGIGSRSIAAFVRRYGAVHDYTADGELFRLRILIPSHSGVKENGPDDGREPGPQKMPGP